jgi:hypothetical protein
MRNGFTRKAWMPRASPSATATIVTSSISEPRVLFGFVRTLLGKSRRAT